MKFINKNSFKNKKYYINTFLCTIFIYFLTLPVNARVPIGLPQPIISSGQTMSIDPRIINQYYQISPQQKQQYRDVLNFMIRYHSVMGPSMMNNTLDTYYFPMIYQSKIDDSDDSDDYDNYDDYNTKKQKKMMVDISDIKLRKTNNKLIFTANKNIQKNNIPISDLKKNLQNNNNNIKTSCKVKKNTTVAQALCINCHNNSSTKKNIQFFKKLDKTIKNFQKKKKFSAIINNFCKSCFNIKIKDFINYVEKRAKENNIPPEIFFAIMIRESNGKCTAQNQESTHFNSVGLFQLHTKNSTKLKVCKKNEMTTMSPQNIKAVCNKRNYNSNTSNKKGVCLNNPYCNFEESLNLIKNKWKYQNKKEKKSESNWLQMSSKKRDQWRKTIISYNSATYLNKAKKNNTKKDWETIRMGFVRQYIETKSKKNKHLINNLAYVERITGRETNTGLSNSSICEWINFKKQNPNPTCKKTISKRNSN